MFVFLDRLVKVKLNCHMTLIWKSSAKEGGNKLICTLIEVKIIFYMINLFCEALKATMFEEALKVKS